MLINNHYLRYSLNLFCIFIFLFLLITNLFIVIPNGFVGIIDKKIKNTGIHFILPWQRTIILDTRWHEIQTAIKCKDLDKKQICERKAFAWKIYNPELLVLNYKLDSENNNTKHVVQIKAYSNSDNITALRSYMQKIGIEISDFYTTARFIKNSLDNNGRAEAEVGKNTLLDVQKKADLIIQSANDKASSMLVDAQRKNPELFKYYEKIITIKKEIKSVIKSKDAYLKIQLLTLLNQNS